MGTCGSKKVLMTEGEFGSKYSKQVTTGEGKKEIVLGQGSFGRVMLCEDRKTKETRAVKVIQKKKGRRTALRTEVEILKQCGEHEHVLQLVDAYETSSSVMLVLELATGGDLLSRVLEKPQHSEHVAADCLRQICSGVEFLHANRIVHRDIKPDNVLIKNQRSFIVKIADFGCSKILPDELFKAIDSDDPLMTSFVGTKAYCAPEILLRKPYGASVDVYSVGVLFAVLLTGSHPLSDVQIDTNFALASNDLNYVIQFDDPKWTAVSLEATELCKNMVHTEPSKRLSPKDILGQIGSEFSQEPLSPSVVTRLQKTRLDRLQQLAARALLKNGNPDLIRQTVEKADKIFDSLDADKTNIIRKNELIDRGLFELVDLDGSGWISREELRAFVLAQSLGDCMPRLVELAFATMDVSQTGQITAQDVLKVAKNLGDAHISLDDVKAWISTHDVSCNGALSKSEFQHMLSFHRTLSTRNTLLPSEPPPLAAASSSETKC